MSAPEGMHPSDPWHVILDALSDLSAAIFMGDARPWEGYAVNDDPTDPKATRDGYEAVLAEAKRIASKALSETPA